MESMWPEGPEGDTGATITQTAESGVVDDHFGGPGRITAAEAAGVADPVQHPRTQGDMAAEAAFDASLEHQFGMPPGEPPKY